jgi:uncharacterized protein YdhG (YjbR/CyaY superfamily)
VSPKSAPPRDVDHYIAGFPTDVQRQLGNVRQAIRRTAPGAQEVISYGMPAYLLNGLGLLSFAAWKKHIALYPAPRGSARFNKQLLPYRAAKSTVRLPLDEPIPVDLLVQIVRLRVKDNVKRAKERAQKTRE